MTSAQIEERNQDATIYVGGLDEKCSEPLLWELFLQAGPVVNVHMPKDRISSTHQGYGFVEFLTEEDADYAMRVMNMIKLYGKPIRVNKASANQKNLDVGANIFIGNLDSEVDEKLLYDTFSAFGVVLQTPKIMRDPESGNSKGFAFVNYAAFEASDAAIEAMNGQYLCNRAITISYAFKKDSKGERHGSAAERLLAAQSPLSHAERPHQLFADAPPSAVVGSVPVVAAGVGSAQGLSSLMIPPPPPPPSLPTAASNLLTTVIVSHQPNGPTATLLPPRPPPPPPPSNATVAAVAAGLFVPGAGGFFQPGAPNMPPPPPPPPGILPLPPPGAEAMQQLMGVAQPPPANVNAPPPPVNSGGPTGQLLPPPPPPPPPSGATAAATGPASFLQAPPPPPQLQ